MYGVFPEKHTGSNEAVDRGLSVRCGCRAEGHGRESGRG